MSSSPRPHTEVRGQFCVLQRIVSSASATSAPPDNHEIHCRDTCFKRINAKNNTQPATIRRTRCTAERAPRGYVGKKRATGNCDTFDTFTWPTWPVLKHPEQHQ